MHEKPDNPSSSGVDAFLNKQINSRIDGYIQKYATNEDGSINAKLADRIRWEVGRRGETGKQLDIYEPLRWTGIRAVLGTIGAAAAKMITDRTTGKTKNLAFGIEIGIVVSTVINSIIDLTRLYPRWLAGLEGGKNTALKLYRENISSPETPTPSLGSEEETPAPTFSKTITKKPAIEPASLIQRAQSKNNDIQNSL